MKSISIVNLKGGVGKTVTAVNLAAILATDYEKRVLLVDVDHQGNASRYCGVNTEERGGLAALLTGGAVCYDEVVEMATMPGVDVIPGRHVARNARRGWWVYVADGGPRDA